MVWRWISAVFRLVAILLVTIQFADVFDVTFLGNASLVVFLVVELFADGQALIRFWHRTPPALRALWIVYEIPVAGFLLMFFASFLWGASVDGAVGQWLLMLLQAFILVAAAKAMVTMLALVGGKVLRLPIVYRVPALSRSIDVSVGRAAVVESLRRRARSTLARAYLVLLLIVGLIGAGVWLIIFAGTIALTDGRATSPSDQVLAIRATYVSSLVSARSELEDNAGRYQTTLLRLQSQGFEIVTDPDGAFVIKRPPNVDLSLLTSQDVGNLASLNATLESKRRAVTDLEASIDHLNTTISQDIPKAILAEQAESPMTTDVSLLVASAVTRFGVLFVIVYLVQILLGVFRYVMRLSTFYHARADVLTLRTERAPDEGKFLSEFMPNDIDFGRAPVTPSQYVVDIVRSFLAGKWNRLKPEGAAPTS